MKFYRWQAGGAGVPARRYPSFLTILTLFTRKYLKSFAEISGKICTDLEDPKT